MPSIEINGGNVVYEILGDSGDLIALTPGGRFSKEIPGLRPLAEALAAGGYRVLLWDRPNCGASDVQFYGQSESHMRAETLHKLVTGLGFERCILAGGSGGARDSMLTTMLYPEMVTRLVVWNIVGGIYGSFVLGSFYIIPSILAVRGNADHVRELLADRVTDFTAQRRALHVDRFADGAAFRDYFKANYGPTIAAYRGIADQPDRVQALDTALAELGDRFLAGSTSMEWEYLLVTARKR